MKNQLLAPTVPDELSVADRVRAWAEIENACQAVLLAGLRHEIGPDGDLDAAYRQWYDRYCEEKTQALVQLCRNFTQRRMRHG